MKFSLSWLKDHLETEASVEENGLPGSGSRGC
jgi:hypothetical protein